MVVRILLDENATKHDISSFENLVAYVAKTKPGHLNEFLDRTWIAVKRPEDRYLYDRILECYFSTLM